MKNSMRVVLLAAALASWMGCSTEGEAGSCFRQGDNACVDYPRAQGAAAKRMCAGLKWTPGEGTCPTANRLGACAKKAGSEWMYGGAPNNYTPASAKGACEFGGGVFTPAAP